MIKEYITLTSKDVIPLGATRAVISWNCQYQNMTARIDGNRVVFEGQNYLLFVLPPATITDGTGKTYEPITYALQGNELTLALDITSISAMPLPIVIDPTVTTAQADCTANRTSRNSSGAPAEILNRRAYIKFALPDLTGFTSIDTATLKLYMYYTGDSSLSSVNTYCDITGAWDETSTYTTLDALTFNAATATNLTITTTAEWKNFDILGATGVNGIRKIYGDDPSPTPCTAKLSTTGTSTSATTSIEIGDDDGLWNLKKFYTRTNATYYPRIEIVYTAGQEQEQKLQIGPVGVLVF